MELALYDPDEGFYGRGGGAGRAGADFLTSPEVGPLFGRLVARALDRWWVALGRPDPYLVAELGAGRGRLAQQVLLAGPACAPALRYLCVERSAVLRERQRELLPIEPAAVALGPVVAEEGTEEVEVEPGRGPIVTSLDELPALHTDGVVLANEVLDNLPFDVVRREPGDTWSELRVGRAEEPARYVPLWTPAEPDLAAWCDGLDAPVGVALPAQRAAEALLADALRWLRRGVVALLDYTTTISQVAGGRPWLRTYHRQQRDTDPFTDPGTRDITADVLTDTLLRAVRRIGARVLEDTTQADWLRVLGIDELVAEGRRAWTAAAAAPDLAAVAGRSRAAEAAALCDPGGLGAHRVLVLGTGSAGGDGW